MKNYLIVGASSGIGKSLSEILAHEGNRIFGTFNSDKSSSNSELKSFNHLNVRDEHLDLGFLPDVIDGVVYCPGAINLKPFHRAKLDDFRSDYELQVIGAIRLIQAVLPLLKKSESPSIILFSTVAVEIGFKFHSIVSSSKGAIEGLMHALAAEYAPHIRVNCIAPSLTNTPLAESMLNTDLKRKGNAERHPLKFIAEPSDIAHMASFLLSEKSKWITGQVLHVDGGISKLKI